MRDGTNVITPRHDWLGLYLARLPNLSLRSRHRLPSVKPMTETIIEESPRPLEPGDHTCGGYGPEPCLACLASMRTTGQKDHWWSRIEVTIVVELQGF
jgi:hypothetical protein